MRDPPASSLSGALLCHHEIRGRVAREGTAFERFERLFRAFVSVRKCAVEKKKAKELKAG